MKLILIHGNNQAAVSKKVSVIKEQFDRLAVTEISGSAQTLDLSSPSLFAEKRLVILENPDLKTLEPALDSGDPDLTILIRCSKTLEKSSPVLKAITQARGEILLFEEAEDSQIFPFLDLLGNKDPKALRVLESNYGEWGSQYLLTMLAYFLRRMVQKPKSGSDFMRQKLERQKKNFPLPEIKDLYREIIETDFKIKQGLLEEKLGLALLVQKILS